MAVVANIGRGLGDNDSISVIDLRANPPRVVETISVGQTPEGIKLSPDGTLVGVVVMNGSNKPKESPFYNDSGKLLLYRLDGTRLIGLGAAWIGHWSQGVVVLARQQGDPGGQYGGAERPGAALGRCLAEGQWRAHQRQRRVGRHPPRGQAVTPRSPLASWFAGAAAEDAFRRRRLGARPALLSPRDRAWRAIAPAFADCLALAEAGSPFQTAVERRYDRSADRRRLPRALAAGESVFFPQVHQVLPRLMRLMVALRATFLGGGREETSFLFLAEGRGREAMGLHHDGETDAFWLQLEGRRHLTIGPPVPRGTPEDLDPRVIPARRAAGPRPSGGWWSGTLAPGTLFYLPPRTPHRVIYHGRSLALSLTWKRRRGPRSTRSRARCWTGTWRRAAPIACRPRAATGSGLRRPRWRSRCAPRRARPSRCACPAAPSPCPPPRTRSRAGSR